MRTLMSRALAIYMCVVSASGLAIGSESLDQMSQDPNQWVMPGGDYGGNRHSKLGQINADNVNHLQVAWTMSTGTLRGHEGQPLVIGDMMYFETAYPNYVYAINLDN